MALRLAFSASCRLTLTGSFCSSHTININIHRGLFSSGRFLQRKQVPQKSESHKKGLTSNAENKEARIELAAAYRIFERLGYNEGICNHLSLLAPAANGIGDVMLLIPYGLHWREVTASNLIGISPECQVVEGKGEAENSAFHIHQGVRTHHQHACVLHLHTPYLSALACLKDPSIKLCHQSAMRFQNEISYDLGFGGYGDNVEEGRRLADALGSKSLMMMGNHGIMYAGNSLADGFDSIYYLERLAMYQVLALSTGKELSIVSDEAVRASQDGLATIPAAAKAHFKAQLRLLYTDCPDFAL